MLFVEVRTSVCFRVLIGLFKKNLIFPHSAKSDKFDGISFSLIQRGKRLNLLSPKISIARVKVKPFLIFRQSVTRNLASLRQELLFTTHIFGSQLAPISCLLKKVKFAALSVTIINLHSTFKRDNDNFLLISNN